MTWLPICGAWRGCDARLIPGTGPGSNPYQSGRKLALKKFAVSTLLGHGRFKQTTVTSDTFDICSLESLRLCAKGPALRFQLDEGAKPNQLPLQRRMKASQRAPKAARRCLKPSGSEVSGR